MSKLCPLFRPGDGARSILSEVKAMNEWWEVVWTEDGKKYWWTGLMYDTKRMAMVDVRRVNKQYGVRAFVIPSEDHFVWL